MEGLEARPLVGSDPPHSMPRMISLISPSVRTSVDSLAAMAQAISPPLAMAFRVPPQPWMVMASTGFPVTAIRLASSLAWIPSQPRPTTRTAPTLAFFPKPSRVRSVCSWSEPIWQQPCWLGTAMAPGTWAAIFSAVSVAHTAESADGSVHRKFHFPVCILKFSCSSLLYALRLQIPTAAGAR